MNREIKFAAWNIKTQRMDWYAQDVYDDYVDAFSNLLDDEDFIVFQYTGKKDKDNNKIYEGHIVLCEDDVLRVVEWFEDEAGFKLRGLLFDDYCDVLSMIGNKFKIIGHIVENK